MSAEVVITITGIRKPGLDESSFHEYITTYHAPLALPFLLKYGVKEYNLVLLLPTSSQTLRVGELLTGYVQLDQFTTFTPHAEHMQMSKKLAEYDYIVQFVMDDIEHFKKLWEDEEFRKSVKPDHANFADETKSGFVFFLAFFLFCFPKAEMC
ncbi:EthD domain-containing protein [Aspergillus falconensis]